jgi:hypothetical protein
LKGKISSLPPPTEGKKKTRRIELTERDERERFRSNALTCGYNRAMDTALFLTFFLFAVQISAGLAPIIWPSPEHAWAQKPSASR